jgi:hypothetical protein
VALSDDGISLTLDNLRSTCQHLRVAFGVARFDKIVSTFSPAQTRGLAAYQLEKAKAHPMAVEWHELMQAVDNSEKAGKLLLPERSLFLLDFLVRLRGLLDLSGIERVLKKLESAGDYFSTVFEIFTLSAYRQIGANIEIVSESTQPNERRADFLVRGKPDCYVECKSLEDLSRREERLWEQVEGRVVKVLLKHRRSWRVIIRAKRALKGNDIADILAVITSRVKAEDINPVRIADGQMDIEFQIYTTERAVGV